MDVVVLGVETAVPETMEVDTVCVTVTAPEGATWWLLEEPRGEVDSSVSRHRTTPEVWDTWMLGVHPMVT